MSEKGPLESDAWEHYQNYGLIEGCAQLLNAVQPCFWQIEGDGGQRFMGFSNGSLVGATSENPAENLIQVFLDRELFTLDQYIQVSGNFSDGESLGAGLLEFGLVTQNELESGQREQLYRIFKACVLQKEGQVRLSWQPQTDLPPAPALPIDLAVLRVCQDFGDKPWIAAAFEDSFEKKPTLKKQVPHQWTKGQWASDLELLLPQIEFGHTVRDIIRSSVLPEFKVLKWLFCLKSLGWLELKAETIPVLPHRSDGPAPDKILELPAPELPQPSQGNEERIVSSKARRRLLWILAACLVALTGVWLLLYAIRPGPVPRSIVPTHAETSNEPMPSNLIEMASKPTDPAIQALMEGDLIQAASLWQGTMVGESEGFTLGIFMACDPENVLKLWRSETHPNLFALPFSFEEQSCYWVCWGKFPDRKEALQARGTMPAALTQLAPDAEAIPFDHFRK